jgi:hypothetical protein
LEFEAEESRLRRRAGGPPPGFAFGLDFAIAIGFVQRKEPRLKREPLSPAAAISSLHDTQTPRSSAAIFIPR